ncbi:DNA binding methylated-DNA--cysteine S-methyltransferase [Eremomyces bilateralis CBS 781.70]|uniref:Methylated-DNA--protein-cysteine methyltransferase n=1 Tax=Eremomyces bilateralis CBS 781.70 TaxID=1392243 RepID=A0A6G1GBF4_9PEZI|nr:DNA binding methylated-DNA--cysteine S-methyltransferase [Eremomyces bilateralis CBS 781.70]KAF1815427.1 DNA binding methylated-DNA--cysteine S-methyltransferase [Eremomyces bilateralis CBS 781.70]
MSKQVTEFQTRVYALLQQIPEGKITSYAAMAKALGSSPRAVGGALRNNPFAPEVPCHRCIASTGYIGGFQGDWQKAPSGVNCEKKLGLLEGEGVKFDARGMLVDRSTWWSEFRV